MKTAPEILFFRTGLRLASFSGILLFVISLFIIGLIIDWSDAFGTAVVLGLSGTIIIYLISLIYLSPKFNRLQKGLLNISDQNFQANEKGFILENDDLDRLYNYSISTNSTIEREIQRLKRIENYRKEFIGDVSHELKTPIFAIQGFIETLLNGALEDEEVNREFLKKGNEKCKPAHLSH